MLGIKDWENRAACPVPAKGHCGMSVSKSSDEGEYANFVALVKSNASIRLRNAIPAWDHVKGWRGKMIAEMDYEVSEAPGPSLWNEGYRYWWKLTNVKRLESPFPVRGNVGMWTLTA